MTASEICIILHIIQKPNSIMSKIIENIAYFLTSLCLLDFLQNFGLFLSTVLGYKQTFFVQIPVLLISR